MAREGFGYSYYETESDCFSAEEFRDSKFNEDGGDYIVLFYKEISRKEYDYNTKAR
jgi:hypothetical protein